VALNVFRKVDDMRVDRSGCTTMMPTDMHRKPRGSEKV
jgi:hypothetical protein